MATSTTICKVYKGLCLFFNRLISVESAANKGGVILYRKGYDDAYFAPFINTDAARGVALRAALAEAQVTAPLAATVELRSGRFTMPDGTTLLASNPGANSTIIFSANSAIIYVNPENARSDSKFFTGVRNVMNFGAETMVGNVLKDNLAAFQTAANLLPISRHGTYFLPSGREFREGKVYIPSGIYGLSSTWEVSATSIIEGEGVGFTTIFLMPNVATGEGDDVWMIKMPIPVGVDANNCFGTGVRDITLAGNRETNTRGCALSYGGGQGTHMRNVHVADWGRQGVDALGGSMYTCWINNIDRGPGLNWKFGGFADILSVEHINPNGLTDGFMAYPAVMCDGGYYQIDQMQGEEGGGNPQKLIRLHNVYMARIGSAIMGVLEGAVRSHLLVHITGTSRSVTVGQAVGSSGGTTPVDPGILVYDESQGSIAGPYVPHTVDGIRGTYSQDLNLS